MNGAKKVATIGVFGALAIVLSILEQYVPVQAVIPLPGVKLGIANVITLLALYKMDLTVAMLILFVRCGVVSLLFGNPVSLCMSLCGGVLALLGMWLLLRFPKAFSLFGVSVAGAALHNVGQICCAMVVLKSVYIIGYLPVLLLAGVVTGLLIAVLTHGVLCARFQ